MVCTSAPRNAPMSLFAAEVELSLPHQIFFGGGIFLGMNAGSGGTRTTARGRRAGRHRRAGIDHRRLSVYAQGVGHELRDELSLELGRRVAARLRGQPELLRIAHDNLERWTRLNTGAPTLLQCYEEWRQILNRPLEEICHLLSSDSEEAQRLRQNSPFAGVLSAREVWELKQRFRHATTAT